MKKHLDPEKIRLAKEMARAIPDFLEAGDEDAYVRALKLVKKDITPEELRERILKFRAAVREKRGLPDE